MISDSRKACQSQVMETASEKNAIFTFPVENKDNSRKIKKNNSQKHPVLPLKWAKPSFQCISMGKLFKCC